MTRSNLRCWQVSIIAAQPNFSGKFGCAKPRCEMMKQITIYTDGACAKNPHGNGGYGAILVYGDTRRELSGGFQRTTNNRMEIYAALRGLEELKEPCDVTIYSDSQYLVNTISKGWARRWRKNKWMRNKTEPALNVDLWERMLALCDKHHVTFQWVRGHAGHPENERCDELAVAALKGADLPIDLADSSVN